MLKKLLIGLVALVVIAGAVLYYLYSNIGDIVKAAIENYGTAAAQAKVTVDKVDLSLTSGEGSIAGILVGNPEGFATAQALSVGRVSVKVDTGSLTSLPIVIKEIVVEAPSVTYERGAGGGNLERIQQNVTRYAGVDGKAQQTPSSSEDEPKIIIENLYVRDGKIAISHTALQGRTLSSGLPTIHLKDIGKDKGGATPAEIAEKVLGAIAGQASKIASVDLDKALGQLKGVVDDQLKGVGKAVEGAQGTVGEQLKGIFGGTQTKQ